MEVHLLESLRQFLHTTERPALRRVKPTFFSIAGIERRELALSNTYAFFFRTDEAHGLGPLFTEALLDVLAVGQSEEVLPLTAPGVVRVAREHPVPVLSGRDRKGVKYLDLLLHNGQQERPVSADATFAILIENKIDHWLHNDLAAYWHSVSEGCEVKIGVVLGVKRHQVPSHLAVNWHPVAHSELAQAVERRIGPVIDSINPHYLPVLLHFLSHLKQMSYSQQNFESAFDFVQQHRAALADVQSIMQAVTTQGLAEVITRAFGPDYLLRKSFEDRADIQRRDRGDFRYVVFFGHVLDLRRLPGYAITLYAGGADVEQVAGWRRHLLNQPQAQQTGMKVVTWYDKLVIGKSYSLLSGSTLHQIEQHIRQSLSEDWQPLEAAWRPHQVAPTI